MSQLHTLIVTSVVYADMYSLSQSTVDVIIKLKSGQSGHRQILNRIKFMNTKVNIIMLSRLPPPIFFEKIKGKMHHMVRMGVLCSQKLYKN